MAYANTTEKLASFRIMPPRREPNGQKQRPTTLVGREAEREAQAKESKDQIMSVALAQPHRASLPETTKDHDGRKVKVDPADPRAGHVLGRLLIHQAINRDQYIAGQRYTELALRHMQHVTGHLPKFPSQAINDTVKGLACTADMSDDEAYELRRSWAEAQRALADTNEWGACTSALANVCVMDRDPRTHADLGSLRVGLNALHRLWK